MKRLFLLTYTAFSITLIFDFLSNSISDISVANFYTYSGKSLTYFIIIMMSSFYVDKIFVIQEKKRNNFIVFAFMSCIFVANISNHIFNLYEVGIFNYQRMMVLCAIPSLFVCYWMCKVNYFRPKDS